jgi:hypothetical protein
VLLEGRVRLTALALAPKHLPDELEFLDILDEITFSRPVRDGFKGHFRILAHPRLLHWARRASRPECVSLGERV